MFYACARRRNRPLRRGGRGREAGDVRKRLTLLHHSKFAIDKLILVQAAFMSRTCRSIREGKVENPGECGDHRKKSWVFVWVDGMSVTQNLHPNGRTEDSERYGGN